MQDILRLNVVYPTFKRMTYTQITTQISTKNTTKKTAASFLVNLCQPATEKNPLLLLNENVKKAQTTMTYFLH